MIDFVSLLKKELIPSFGCTEPIALAFTSSKAVEILDVFPDFVEVKCSGNIVKNAKSVVIPNSGGKKGIEYSVILGAILQSSEKQLEILETVSPEDILKAEKLYKENFCRISLLPNVENLYITVEAVKEEHRASVTVKNGHTNIIEIQKNGKILYERTEEEEERDKCSMSFNSIYDFATTGNIDGVREVIKKQILYNMVIAEEGLERPWGANIGKLLLQDGSKSLQKKIQAYAAAASDARMSGCALPVVINSGSGNQGLTVSIPIIISAYENGRMEEELYRALVFANLMNLYLKSGIGKLSAYCGVVSAASAGAAGIAFLAKEDKEVIASTLSNSLACTSGIICDGAKPSCSMKISTALGAALLAYDQAKTDNSFKEGDGIVKNCIDETIKTVGIIGHQGMKETDLVILNEMLKN